MEKGGWIERRPHETDRRANRILLKTAGKRKFTQLRDIAAGLQLEILDVLPKKDREKFLEQLADIAKAGHAAAEQAARMK